MPRRKKTDIPQTERVENAVAKIDGIFKTLIREARDKDRELTREQFLAVYEYLSSRVEELRDDFYSAFEHPNAARMKQGFSFATISVDDDDDDDDFEEQEKKAPASRRKKAAPKKRAATANPPEGVDFIDDDSVDDLDLSDINLDE